MTGTYGTRKSDFGHYPISHITYNIQNKTKIPLSPQIIIRHIFVQKYIYIRVAYTNKAQILEIRHWSIISSNKSPEFNPILSTRVQLKNYKHHYIILLLHLITCFDVGCGVVESQ